MTQMRCINYLGKVRAIWAKYSHNASGFRFDDMAIKKSAARFARATTVAALEACVHCVDGDGYVLLQVCRTCAVENRQRHVARLCGGAPIPS